MEEWLRSISELIRKIIADEVEKAVADIRQQLADLKHAIPDWIDQEEACALTGRSESWFYTNRQRDTLPIAMLPRAEKSRRIKYSKADCIAYGRQRRILPPWYPNPGPTEV